MGLQTVNAYVTHPQLGQAPASSGVTARGSPNRLWGMGPIRPTSDNSLPIPLIAGRENWVDYVGRTSGLSVSRETPNLGRNAGTPARPGPPVLGLVINARF